MSNNSAIIKGCLAFITAYEADMKSMTDRPEIQAEETRLANSLNAVEAVIGSKGLVETMEGLANLATYDPAAFKKLTGIFALVRNSLFAPEAATPAS